MVTQNTKSLGTFQENHQYQQKVNLDNALFFSESLTVKDKSFTLSPKKSPTSQPQTVKRLPNR
jgi:hypothetical protein